VNGNRARARRRRSAVHLSAAAAASLLVVAAVGLGSTSLAAADCAGPTVRHEVGTFDRGGTLSVEGLAFGDSCYDTGPPPEGQGVLGKPIEGISVLVVQGGDEHLVAEGAADAEYGFTVDVLLPADLTAGEADVVVRYADGAEAYDPDLLPFTVSDAAPVEPATSSAAVATFGPAAPAEPEVVQVPGEGDDDGEVVSRGGEGDPPLGWFIASGVAAFGAVGVLLLLRRRQSSITSGDDET
jgi:hypothetical protein